MGPDDLLDNGDAGSLAGALDSVTETVQSVERFANTVKTASSFEVVLPLVWAIIALWAARWFIQLLRPWNDGAARRWEATGRVTNRRTPKDYEAQIASLNARIAELLAELEEARAPTPAKPELHLVEQVD
jgi:hypothetical protein